MWAPPEVEAFPEVRKVPTEDLHADRDEVNTMISEGGPACSTASVSIPGTRGEKERLTGMIQALQANQATLTGLLNWYGTFVFMGGDVPSGQFDLIAINSYLERPFAANRISTGEVGRYRRLVGTIKTLGQGIPSGPKTLWCRTRIGNEFLRASSEIQTLGRALESALTSLSQSSPESQSVSGVTDA